MEHVLEWQCRWGMMPLQEMRSDRPKTTKQTVVTNNVTAKRPSLFQVCCLAISLPVDKKSNPTSWLISDLSPLSLCLHSVLEEPATYARRLFVDDSSAFNPILPSSLCYKLLQLGHRWSELLTGSPSLWSLTLVPHTYAFSHVFSSDTTLRH